MTDIRFTCTACGQSLEATLDMAGDAIECPKCQETLIVPKSEFKKCPFCAERIQTDAIKCKHCGEMLLARNSPPRMPTEVRRKPNVGKGEVMCPNCHYIGMPKRKSKGSLILGLFLCLFWLLPGIIYFIAMSGYKYICPQCGIKIQKE